MKITIILAALSALVGAQSPADFPPCSAECLDYAMSNVGCATGAIECGCTSYVEINGYITTCLENQCTPAEDCEFRNLAMDICAHAGVPIENLDSHELYTMELHNLSGDSDNIITAHTLGVITVTRRIEHPIETPYIDTILVPQPEFTGVPNGSPSSSLPSASSFISVVPSGSPTELPWGTSTMTPESTVEVSSYVVPYPTPIPIYTTTIGINSTSSSPSSLPTYTGAAVMGARAEGALAAGLIGIFGLVL